MKLYIVRHGETDWNKERRVQGHTDIPLNDYGRHLAEETARGMKNIRIDMAYTSPLSRARETAQIILGDRDVPLYDEERIKELGFGSYEGLCCSGENREPGSDEFNKFFTDTENYVSPEDGETVTELFKRTGDFLKEICTREDLKEKHILVSTHGASMTALLNHIKGNMAVADFWRDEVPPNCSVTVVEVQDGRAKIVEQGVIYYKEKVRQWKVE